MATATFYSLVARLLGLIQCLGLVLDQLWMLLRNLIVCLSLVKVLRYPIILSRQERLRLSVSKLRILPGEMSLGL